METKVTVNAMVQASEAGAKWAKALQPGDNFMGASPAAIEAGHARGTACYRLFLNSALDVLATRHPLRTDENGIILQIGGAR